MKQAPKSITEHKIYLEGLRKEVSGYCGDIAEATGVSKTAVIAVLRGDWNNALVIQAAENVRKYLQKMSKLKNKA